MTFNRSSSIVGGVIMLALGVIMLLAPGFVMASFSIFAGLGFFIAAISAFGAWGVFKGLAGGGITLFTGILCIIMAVVCFLHPLAFATTVTWIIALCAIFGGIAQLATYINAKNLTLRPAGIAASILIILFGILALAMPESIVVYLGICLVIEGIAEILVGIKTRPIDVYPL